MFSSPKSPRRPRSRALLAIVSTLLFASLAVSALAVHWSHSGGDAGRSGYQPVEETGPPVSLAYAASDGSPIRTSILTNAGSLANQRTIYTTSDGRVHHRGLDDGEPSFTTKLVLSPDFVVDSDALGGSLGTISPVEASTPTASGFTYQIFNDDAAAGDPLGSDIVLSVFRQTDGTLIDTVRIPDGTNYTVTNTPILFQDALWFVATPDSATAPSVPPPDPNATTRLFKVNIGNPTGAGGSNPTIGSTKFRNVTGATSTANPTGLYLKDAEGNPKPYVALSFTSGNSVRTFAADTPDPASTDSAGPASGDLPGGTAFTSSVPVLPNGRAPGPGEAVTAAPYLYVAVQTTLQADTRTGTQVFKLRQAPDAPATLVLPPDEVNTSSIMAGNAGVMLAVSQLATEPAPESGGHIVMSNACDVYSISVANMRDIEPLLGPNAAPDCATTSTTLNPATGFRRTTAALSGNLGFIQRNNGDQLVFTIDRADQLPPEQFTGESDPQEATAAFGQPAISRRLIQFGDDKRLSVYRAQSFVPSLDSGARFSINDVTVTEGNSGTQQATFTVSRIGILGGNVTVSTADNTAKAGEDYTATTTELTFTRGETSKTVTVPVIGDRIDEPDETFFVRLSDPEGAGATLLDPEGLGLITDDDSSQRSAQPTVAISDLSVAEGSTATFNVGLSEPSSQNVTLDYGTADDTAKAGSDYRSTTGSLVFTPGQTSKTITVRVLADRVKDPNERFFVGLVNIKGATSADPVGSALIDDVQPDRLKARGFSASTKPKRDATAPFRFVTTGRLVRPKGVSRSSACRGRVGIQVKVIRRTISNRRAKLRKDCTYRSAVTFRNPNRFGNEGRLKFVVRFLGNADVLRTQARKQFVRTK